VKVTAVEGQRKARDEVIFTEAATVGVTVMVMGEETTLAVEPHG
jgi:hypothetical protein